MYVWTPYISWNKVLLWRRKNYWYLNFSCALSIMKIGQALEILLSWPWVTPIPMKLTCFGKPFVTTSWNNIDLFCYIKVFIPTHLIVFPAVSCWLKALGICAEGLWIRADFLYEVRLSEEYPSRKISLVNLHTELKAHK